MQAAAATADAAIPAPIGPATNAGLVWNGSSWTSALLANANISGSAAIAYSKLSLAGSIVNNDVSTSAAIALSKLADPGSGNVVTSAGAGAVAAKPPGYEMNYTQITSAANVTDTSEATATAIISPGAITFDGSPVIVEFFTSAIQPPQTTTGVVVVSLFEGATQVARLAAVQNAAASVIFVPTYARYRFTPTAGAHTYKITAFANVTTGTPFINAGSGGTSGAPPAFVRFTKV